MPGLTIAFGLILIALGVVGYFATGRQSPTALIPAFAGALFTVLGVVAQKPGLRKHAMHAAALLGVLGLVGTAGGIPRLITLLAGGAVARPAAAVVQSVMAVLSALFVAACVRSFIEARRARAGAAALSR